MFGITLLQYNLIDNLVPSSGSPPPTLTEILLRIPARPRPHYLLRATRSGQATPLAPELVYDVTTPSSRILRYLTTLNTKDTASTTAATTQSLDRKQHQQSTYTKAIS